MFDFHFPARPELVFHDNLEGHQRRGGSIRWLRRLQFYFWSIPGEDRAQKPPSVPQRWPSLRRQALRSHPLFTNSCSLSPRRWHLGWPFRASLGPAAEGTEGLGDGCLPAGTPRPWPACGAPSPRRRCIAGNQAERVRCRRHPQLDPA